MLKIEIVNYKNEIQRLIKDKEKIKNTLDNLENKSINDTEYNNILHALEERKQEIEIAKNKNNEIIEYYKEEIKE